MVHWQIMQLCMCSPITVGARSGFGVTRLPVKVGYTNDCAAVQHPSPRSAGCGSLHCEAVFSIYW